MHATIMILLAGLMMGMALHPNSNLLGGVGLTFGPIWWRGGPVAVSVVIVCVTVGVWRRLVAPRLGGRGW